MIQKLFNFAKKKSEYYLELDEDESLQDKFTEAKEAVEDKFNQAKEVVAERVNTANKEAQKQTDSAKKDVEKVVESAKKDDKKSKPAEADKNSPKVAQPSATNGAASDSSEASSWEQPFWVKAMFEKSSNNGKQATEDKSTFATDNLMPIPTNYRRRPGPSLDKYKAMANETKTSRS